MTWDDEPTRPGTPDAKRTHSAELRAVNAENVRLRVEIVNLRRQVAFVEKRHDALVLRVQALENSAR